MCNLILYIIKVYFSSVSLNLNFCHPAVFVNKTKENLRFLCASDGITLYKTPMLTVKCLSRCSLALCFCMAFEIHFPQKKSKIGQEDGK